MQVRHSFIVYLEKKLSFKRFLSSESSLYGLPLLNTGCMHAQTSHQVENGAFNIPVDNLLIRGFTLSCNPNGLRASTI